MSSMRNAIQRRNHKERAQPREREKWGLLEKHKDYTLRSSDFNEKKRRLKSLRQKAADQNPDEFHFAMMKSKVDGTGQKFTDRGNLSLTHDVVKLLKTQDAGYLRNALQRTKQSRERLEKSILLQDHCSGWLSNPSDDSPINRKDHVLFVDSTFDQKSSPMRMTTSQKQCSTIQDRANDPSEDEKPPISHTQDATTDDQMKQQGQRNPQSQPSIADTCIALKRQKRGRDAQRNHLVALKEREQSLLSAEYEIDMQRQKLRGNDGGINQWGVKFKARDRKR